MRMLFRLETAALVGLTAYPVVEVDIGRGLPAVTVVGLGGTAVLEARDRLRCAVRQHRLRVARPAHHRVPPRPTCRRRGSGFDLPIAVGLLAAAVGAAGRPRGPVGDRRARPRRRRPRGPGCCRPPWRHRSGARLLVVWRPAWSGALVPACGWPARPRWSSRRMAGRPGRARPPRGPARASSPWSRTWPTSAASSRPRRALEIAAAGPWPAPHRPPGAGKTMLARRLPGFSHPSTRTRRSGSHPGGLRRRGLLGPDAGLIRVRPFRDPHHAISVPGLVGGGQVPRPGEVSLANHGVLFLDQLPEFSRSACGPCVNLW